LPNAIILLEFLKLFKHHVDIEIDNNETITSLKNCYFMQQEF